MGDVIYINEFLSPKYEDFDWISPILDQTKPGQLRDMLLYAFTCEQSAYRHISLAGFTQDRVCRSVALIKKSFVTTAAKGGVLLE